LSSNLSVSELSERENPVPDTCERYKFTVSYDGTLYWGFQRQKGRRTIQSELETALTALGWKETGIISAGRTDSGVHADGQVFSARLAWRHSPEALRAALNARLPEDISVKDVERVPDNFHARYDAFSRTYRYRIYFAEVRDPLRDRFRLRLWPESDLKTLNQAAHILLGEHDFRAFGSPPRKNGTTVRRVIASGWIPEDRDEIAFEIEANGFLYHMVRRMVFLQLQWATDRIDWKTWEDAVLNAKPTHPGIAPAKGLSLYRVRYEKL